jgi:hypothetical protein
LDFTLTASLNLELDESEGGGLGKVDLLFHPAELYNYYGFEIRRDLPFEDALVVRISGSENY